MNGTRPKEDGEAPEEPGAPQRSRSPPADRMEETVAAEDGRRKNGVGEEPPRFPDMDNVEDDFDAPQVVMEGPTQSPPQQVGTIVPRSHQFLRSCEILFQCRYMKRTSVKPDSHVVLQQARHCQVLYVISDNGSLKLQHLSVGKLDY